MTVGPRAALERRTVTRLRGELDSRFVRPRATSRVTAQIRHRHPEAPATVAAAGWRSREVEFDLPQHAVAPGQALVMYDGERSWVEGG